jgi:hypothetical protein
MNERQAVLESLRTDIQRLEELVGKIPPDKGSRLPSPGGWSPAMVVSHLADSELMSAVRIRLVLTRDRAPLTAYDQDFWAERFSPLEPSLEESYNRFRTLRENNLRVLESLDSEQWQRVGMHEERGEVSVAQLVELIHDHVPAHMEQIRECLT